MSVKKNSLSINKKDLVQIVSSKLKNSGIGTVPNDKLTKIFNLFTNEIVNSLKDDRSVNLRGEFSISTWMSKPILKNNPSAAGEKFVIPSQRRVRFRISDNWRGILNPLVHAINLIRGEKSIESLEKLHKKFSEVYKKDKVSFDRINEVYNVRLKNLKKKNSI